MAENDTALDKTLPGSARAFLAAFRETGSIRTAAAAAGVSRQLHYIRLKELPGYREAFEAVQEDAADRLEEEARRRAVEGWEEPVYQKGQYVGTVRKYSDALLLALLRANRPAKYVHPRAQSVTQIVDARGSGPTLVNLDATIVNRRDVSPARRADYERFLALLRAEARDLAALQPTLIEPAEAVAPSTPIAQTIDDAHDDPPPDDPPCDQD